jgi:hypothetical protein
MTENRFATASNGRVASAYALDIIRTHGPVVTDAAIVLLAAALADEATLSADGYMGTPAHYMAVMLGETPDDPEFGHAVNDVIDYGWLESTDAGLVRIPEAVYNRADAPTEPKRLPYSQEHGVGSIHVPSGHYIEEGD